MTAKERRRVEELEDLIKEREEAFGELDQNDPNEKQYSDIHKKAIGRYTQELEKLKERSDEKE